MRFDMDLQTVRWKRFGNAMSIGTSRAGSNISCVKGTDAASMTTLSGARLEYVKAAMYSWHGEGRS